MQCQHFEELTKITIGVFDEIRTPKFAFYCSFFHMKK